MGFLCFIFLFLFVCLDVNWLVCEIDVWDGNVDDSLMGGIFVVCEVCEVNLMVGKSEEKCLLKFLVVSILMCLILFIFWILRFWFEFWVLNFCYGFDE